jgi:hypothetical protein
MLLDESSSMTPHRLAVVNTFNEYTGNLKKGSRMWLSLFKFSNQGWYGAVDKAGAPTLRQVFENRKLKETYPLTASQYVPNGMTPLYDAIGALIQRTKKRLPKEAKVLFVIHTDGQENDSHEFNMERIKNLIARMEKKRGWTFVYLGEGAEAWNAGYDFGIDNVANFSSSMREQTMTKLAVGTQCYAMNASVGGAAGSTKTFYADANLDADDIDPADAPHVSSTAAPSADAVKVSNTAEADDS